MRSLYNGRVDRGERMRAFRLSHLRERDMWQCLAEESVQVPSIHLPHECEASARHRVLPAASPLLERADGPAEDRERKERC